MTAEPEKRADWDMPLLPFQLALATTAEPPFIDKRMYGLRQLMCSIQRRFDRCCHR